MSETRREAGCPRCGYDQSGAMPGWTEQCPVEGRCTECGLEYDWGEVLRVSEHPWLFEYHWRRGPLKRLCLTVARALVPWRFWREVRMSDPIYMRPVIALCVLCVAVGLAAVVGKNAYQSMWIGGSDLTVWLRRIPGTIVELPGYLWRHAPGVVVTLLAMPALFLMLPVSLRRARVRRGHVLRIWLYSLVFPAMLTVIWIALALLFDVIGWRWGSRALNPDVWFVARGRDSTVNQLILARFGPTASLMLVAVAWLIPWWWIACRDYLRLPHSRLTVALLGLVLVMLGLLTEISRF